MMISMIQIPIPMHRNDDVDHDQDEARSTKVQKSSTHFTANDDDNNVKLGVPVMAAIAVRIKS